MINLKTILFEATVGKVFIGTTLAQAAYSLWQQNQPVAAKQQKKAKQCCRRHQLCYE